MHRVHKKDFPEVSKLVPFSSSLSGICNLVFANWILLKRLEPFLALSIVKVKEAMSRSLSMAAIFLKIPWSTT